MSLRKFPFVRFGTCPVCGGSGPDDSEATGCDAATDRTDAVSRQSDADEAGVEISDDNGYPLYYYQGELMCEMCIKEKKADAKSELAASRHADKDKFLAKAGFVKEVADE